MKKTLHLLTAIALVLFAQVAPAQSTPAPTKVDPRPLAQQLITLVNSPTAHRGTGVEYQRMDPVQKTSDTQSFSVVAEGNDEFGYGKTYGLKDKIHVRIIMDSEGHKGLEMWWPRTDEADTGLSNVITVHHDGSFGYCMLNGQARHPSGTDSPCGEKLPLDAVLTEFATIGKKIAEYMTPR